MELEALKIYISVHLASLFAKVCSVPDPIFSSTWGSCILPSIMRMQANVGQYSALVTINRQGLGPNRIQLQTTIGTDINVVLKVVHMAS